MERFLIQGQPQLNFILCILQVQRTAKPPVCKLMDYQREKYEQRVKEKERIKSKVDYFLKIACIHS